MLKKVEREKKLFRKSVENRTSPSFTALIYFSMLISIWQYLKECVNLNLYVEWSTIFFYIFSHIIPITISSFIEPCLLRH